MHSSGMRTAHSSTLPGVVSGQKPHAQRPPWRETPPEQRTPCTDPPNRLPLDRDPPRDGDPLDRHPLPREQNHRQV